MTQPPILKDDPTVVEKRLLGSARLDIPSPSQRDRAVAAIGLSASALAAARAQGAPAGAAGVLKWLALGAVGSATVVGALHALRPPEPRNTPPSAVVAVPARTASDVRSASSLPLPWDEPSEAPPDQRPSVADGIPPAPLLPFGALVGSVPDAGRRTSGRSPTATAPQRTREVEPSKLRPTDEAALSDEVTALDEVRRDLAAGAASASLRMLDAYDQRFPEPSLGTEASLLRIESLLALREVDLARQLGERLLAQPSSRAYAQRIRSLLRGAGETNP